MPCGHAQPTGGTVVPQALSCNGSTASPTPAQSLRILVIDDNRSVVESLKMLLDLNGNTTHTAYDGLEGIEIAERVRPEIILLDIGLPRIDGWETCRRIRQQSWGNQVMVYALTALGQDDDRLKSQQAGFDMHFVKPVDPELLLTVLEATRLHPPPTDRAS
jgi:DNA-binding response OmpR family regulator